MGKITLIVKHMPANSPVLSEIQEALLLVKSYRKKVQAVKEEAAEIIQFLEEDLKLKSPKSLIGTR